MHSSPGPRSPSALSTGTTLLIHVERKSLFTTISKLHRATAKAAQRATVRRLKPLHRNVRTITYDNGEEFAAPERTARSLNTRIFFATP